MTRLAVPGKWGIFGASGFKVSAASKSWRMAGSTTEPAIRERIMERRVNISIKVHEFVAAEQHPGKTRQRGARLAVGWQLGFLHGRPAFAQKTLARANFFYCGRTSKRTLVGIADAFGILALRQ